MLLLLPVAGFGQHRHLEFENIYRQIKDKNFFKARDMFRETKKLPADYRYFTEAVLDNAFNKPEESNQKILKLSGLTTELPDSLMLKISHIKEDNCMKQYDYSGAKMLCR